MTEAETAELMAVLMAAYPNQSIGEPTLKVYAMMLRDLDYLEVMDASQHLLSECRFFPTIAEIRQTVAERRCTLPEPAEAWGEVMRAIRDVGFYGRPHWSSDAVRRAVAAIGWENICQCERDDLNTLRAQFERIFAAYRKRTIQGENLSGLGLGEGSESPRLPTGTEGMKRVGDIVPFKREGQA